jgi:hypothetical protein
VNVLAPEVSGGVLTSSGLKYVLWNLEPIHISMSQAQFATLQNAWNAPTASRIRSLKGLNDAWPPKND